MQKFYRKNSKTVSDLSINDISLEVEKCWPVKNEGTSTHGVLKPEENSRIEIIAKQIIEKEETLQFDHLVLGRLYFLAKSLLPHGEFMDWATKVSKQPYRTIQNCIGCFLVVRDYECLRTLNRGLLNIIGRPSFFEDLRAMIAERVLSRKGIFNLKCKDALVLQAKVASGEWSIDGDEVRKVLDIEVETQWIAFYKRKLLTICKQLKDHMHDITTYLETKAISGTL